MENLNKFYVNTYRDSAGIVTRVLRGVVLDYFDSRDDDKLRVVAQECGVSNEIIIRGRIKGADDWDDLKTLISASSVVVNVSTYDEIQIEVVVFDAPSGRFKLIASGFSIAGGDIEVSAPAGIDSQGTTSLSFSSSDSTVLITGDGEGGLDFSVVAVSGANFKPEQVRVLSAGEIAAKSITLASTPTAPLLTQLFVQGAPMQVYGQDFVVSGNNLIWNMLGLDGELEEGDRVVVIYT